MEEDVEDEFEDDNSPESPEVVGEMCAHRHCSRFASGDTSVGILAEFCAQVCTRKKKNRDVDVAKSTNIDMVYMITWVDHMGCVLLILIVFTFSPLP